MYCLYIFGKQDIKSAQDNFPFAASMWLPAEQQKHNVQVWRGATDHDKHLERLTSLGGNAAAAQKSITEHFHCELSYNQQLCQRGGRSNSLKKAVGKLGESATRKWEPGERGSGH